MGFGRQGLASLSFASTPIGAQIIDSPSRILKLGVGQLVITTETLSDSSLVMVSQLCLGACHMKYLLFVETDLVARRQIRCLHLDLINMSSHHYRGWSSFISTFLTAATRWLVSTWSTWPNLFFNKMGPISGVSIRNSAHQHLNFLLHCKAISVSINTAWL